MKAYVIVRHDGVYSDQRFKVVGVATEMSTAKLKAAVHASMRALKSYRDAQEFGWSDLPDQCPSPWQGDWYRPSDNPRDINSDEPGWWRKFEDADTHGYYKITEHETGKGRD
jgi:hypothetical protein